MYDRARLSLKMLKACTIYSRLSFPWYFHVGIILPALVLDLASLWRNPAIPIMEAILDVISKLLQMNIIMDVHSGVFDDP